jgi:transcriptional regulator with XRE-family HTH domain
MLKRGRLAQRRKAVGLTQEQLAERLGVERTTVMRWERGQTQPQPWLRPQLAKALRVSADRIEELLAADVPDSSQGPAVVPRQLPAAAADFTGRAAELAALTGMLDRAGAPGTVVISAIGGTAGQATSSRLLANTATQLGDHDGARAHLEHSLGLYRRLGNRLGEAKAYQDLNVLAERQGRYADALSHSQQALCLYQAIWTAPGSLEAVTSGKVGAHGIQEGASR